jgi:DNA-binding winged helix-turn-helix (wHTH) protein
MGVVELNASADEPDHGVRFHDLVFDRDLLGAVRDDGAEVRLTRLERALLGQFVAHPQRLLSRAQLLSALSDDAEDISDRNIDFIVNRLRRKLKDPARKPRFIATQYGEGYVWIAEQRPLASDPVLLVVGPVRGLGEGMSEAVLEPLRDAIRARIAQEHSVLLAPDGAPGATAGISFSVEVSFHRASERVHIAYVLRCEPTRAVVASFRQTFAGALPKTDMAGLALAITDAVWKHLALGPRVAVAPTDPPLHLRMHDASALLDPPGVSWLANGEQLARLRAEDPADPSVAIMSAMHLFARTILAPGPEPLTRKAVTTVEDEIEALVLEHLPAVGDDPVMALAAAKLLLLINRGHDGLAESLATRAFAGSAAFASALPMLGQVHAYRGDLEEARRLYDEALQLCEPGSTFEIYILVLKAMTHLAQDDHPAAGALLGRIVELQPFPLATTAWRASSRRWPIASTSARPAGWSPTCTTAWPTCSRRRRTRPTSCGGL